MREQSAEVFRNQSKLLQSILDSVADGVVVADERGKFLLFNPAAERILGVGATDAPTDAWPETYGTFHPDTVTPWPASELPLPRAMRGESSDGVVMFIRNVQQPDGVFIRLTGRPMRDEQGVLTGGVVVFHDITADRRLAEEKQRLHQALADRSVQLEAVNKELESFSYSVSHDLRSPLRAIDGFSKALMEDYADRLDERGKDFAQRVRSAAQRMGQLIDDMLELARVTRKEMRRERVDLSALARSILAELQRSAPVRQVAVRVAEGLVVQGDSHLLQAALQNLLENAWKFTSKRPEATIEVGACPDQGERIYFVRDDGAGFDMAYADKLFGPFQRLHDMTEFPGTGIGLATVQRIMTRHGGRVWAEGIVEKGATVFFTLPVEERKPS